MPVMDGFEFLKQVRHADELKHTPIIVSSASVSQPERQMALDRGGDDFLPKPVDVRLLLHLLSDHLKVEWVYQAQAEDSGESEFPVELVLPPRPTLETLLNLAQRDNIKTLREHLEQLMDNDNIYTPFAEAILKLAKQFQTEDIEELLQQYLTEGLDDGE